MTILTPTLATVKNFTSIEIGDKLLCPTTNVTGTFDIPSFNLSSLHVNNVTLTCSEGSTNTLTLPVTPGEPGQYLTSDGNGNLVWTTVEKSVSTTTDAVAPTATQFYIDNTTQTFTGVKTFTQRMQLNNGFKTTTAFFTLSGAPRATLTFNTPVLTTINSATNNTVLLHNTVTPPYKQTIKTNVVDRTEWFGSNTNVSTTPSYYWSLYCLGGTTENGSGDLVFEAASTQIKAPGTSTVNFYIDEVLLPTADRLNYVSGATSETKGNVIASKPPMTDINNNVSGFTKITSKAILYKALRISNTVRFTGSHTMADNIMVYIATPTSALCNLILQVPATAQTGRIVYVFRSETTSTHALILNATSNNVKLNGVTTNISTTVPNKMFTLFNTGNTTDGWVLL
jgi:hypothetical protein